MPAKRDKLPTNVTLTPQTLRSLVETRNKLIIQLADRDFKKAEISWIFNVSKQLVNSIINKK